jgi:hypothetical protein
MGREMLDYIPGMVVMVGTLKVVQWVDMLEMLDCTLDGLVDILDMVLLVGTMEMLGCTLEFVLLVGTMEMLGCTLDVLVGILNIDLFFGVLGMGGGL